MRNKIILVGPKTFNAVVEKLGYVPDNLRDSQYVEEEKAIIADMSKPFNPRKKISGEELINMFTKTII